MEKETKKESTKLRTGCSLRSCTCVSAFQDKERKWLRVKNATAKG